VVGTCDRRRRRGGLIWRSFERRGALFGRGERRKGGGWSGWRRVWLRGLDRHPRVDWSEWAGCMLGVVEW
jgi:hypothetical protein